MASRLVAECILKRPVRRRLPAKAVLASLAVTPARHIFGWADLIAIRRLLGIGGLALTALWGFQQVTVKWIAHDVSLVMQAALRSISVRVSCSAAKLGCCAVEGLRASNVDRLRGMRIGKSLEKRGKN